jgi:hypothetical protein
VSSQTTHSVVLRVVFCQSMICHSWRSKNHSPLILWGKTASKVEFGVLWFEFLVWHQFWSVNSFTWNRETTSAFSIYTLHSCCLFFELWGLKTLSLQYNACASSSCTVYRLSESFESKMNESKCCCSELLPNRKLISLSPKFQSGSYIPCFPCIATGIE